MPEAPLRRPTFEYVDLTAPGNPTGATKNDSGMPSYNAYGSGKGGLCDEIWDTSLGGSGSYWCGNNSAGGWAEVDGDMASRGERHLPVGMTYDQSLPNLRRLASWANATGAVVRAWHPQSWALYMWNVSAHDPATGRLAFDRGGWQAGRVWCRCDQCDYVCPAARKGNATLQSGSWFVENVREELSSPGEWFFNESSRELYLWPNGTEAGGGAPPPASGQLVASHLTSLLRIEGGARDITVRDLGFRDAGPVFLAERWGVPSGGDWALHRGGALHLEGTTNVTVGPGNTFERLDGTAVFIGGRNRDATVRGSSFAWLGDNAVALWGDSREWDATRADYPRGTSVLNNIFRELGIHEKQSSAVFLAKSARTTVAGNVMFNLPRAAININDGAMGGHLIERNLIFNSCRESGDHGAINSWDRQPFLHAEAGGMPSFAPLPIVIRQNYITANYGSSQGVDNDDGSSHYRIESNVFYAADGFKMDYGGHDSAFAGNLVLVKAYDSQNCVNLGGSFGAGHGDTFSNNSCVVLGCATAQCDDRYGSLAQCDARRVSMAGNAYYTHHGNASLECGGAANLSSLAQVQALGLEAGSTAGPIPPVTELLGMAARMLEQWAPL